MSLNLRLFLSVALFSALVVACGDEDDDFVPDPYGDGDVLDDSGPADEDATDSDGDGDVDAGDGDVDNGDGDGGPTDDDPPPPPVYGLEERPSQQTCQAFTAPPVTDEISFVDRFPNIRFSGSVSISQRPGDNSRIYVNERGGHIYSFPNDPTALATDKVEALDLSDVQFTGWDCSTASLVFPSDFATHGAAYVVYCHQFPSGGGNPHIQVRLSRFYSGDGGLTFDRGSEQVIVAINYNETADPADADPGYGRSCSHTVNEDGLHAGNAAHFGPDGYLYWAVGDGGPQGHCGGKQAQHLSTLRGKLLRIDVSDLAKQINPALLGFNEGWQYTAVDAPPDNPYYGTGADPNPTYNIEAGIVQPLIYARGFRNPWQWNFDPADNSIWLGDVGNNTWEEVNRNVVAGGNYGWGYFEGTLCSNGWGSTEYPDDGMGPVNPACTTFDNQVRWPMLELRHSESYDRNATPEEARLPTTIYGRAISGGLVYRGSAVPAYTGSYFFGDYSTQRIWAVRNVDAISQASGTVCTSSADCATGLVCKSHELPYENGYDPQIVNPPGVHGRCVADFELVQTGVPVASFGRDQDGNVYAVMLFGAPGTGNGWIGMLRATPATGGSGGPPDLLSETGCFEVVDDGGTPTVGEPVTDLIPFKPAAELWSDGASKRRWMTVPDAFQVTVDASGDFEFPPGSVLVKEFSLFGQKIETRFLMRQVADGRWAAYTYEWNDEQTDATLVPEIGAEKTWGTTPDDQNWHYPGRSQCFQCHNTVDKVVLGPETAQLNHDMDYPESGETANQMLTLEHIELVDTALDPAPWANLAAITDTSRTLEERARSYLHANCSICHRPDGPTFTPPDMRYGTAFASMNICDQQPSISDMGEPASRLLLPGDASLSQIHMRPASTNGAYRMPPLATSIPHTEALAVIEQWIESISTCE